MKGTARLWDVAVSAVQNEAGDHIGYLAISRDITEVYYSREAEAIANQELHHRLKNTYLIITNLLNAFARGNDENRRFAADMTDRLLALCKSQTLFCNGNAPCDLAQLIHDVTKPFERQGMQFDRQIPFGVKLDQEKADAVALIVGELAVNSSKHGAVLNGGSVRLKASPPNEAMYLEWTEVSESPVLAQIREGSQGMHLMQRIMEARCGELQISWRGDGLTAVLRFHSHPT